MVQEINAKTGKTKIVILGGGFAGVETARYLDRTAAKRADVERSDQGKCGAPGFLDTALSASLLGDELENRRNQLRATLSIRRVVGPANIAALAVHIMTNTALTGASYDVDGGQQLVAA